MSLQSSSVSTPRELFSPLGSSKPCLKKLLFRTQSGHLPCSYTLAAALNSCRFSRVYFSGQRSAGSSAGVGFAPLPPFPSWCMQALLHHSCALEWIAALAQVKNPPLPRQTGWPRATPQGLGWRGWEEGCQVRTQASRMAEMCNHSSQPMFAASAPLVHRARASIIYCLCEEKKCG